MNATRRVDGPLVLTEWPSSTTRTEYIEEGERKKERDEGRQRKEKMGGGGQVIKELKEGQRVLIENKKGTSST